MIALIGCVKSKQRMFAKQKTYIFLRFFVKVLIMPQKHAQRYIYYPRNMDFCAWMI